MSEQEGADPSRPRAAEPGAGLARRRQREAEQLRDNLRRRKEQSRARTETAENLTQDQGRPTEEDR
jgi:hypothetical protein